MGEACGTKHDSKQQKHYKAAETKHSGRGFSNLQARGEVQKCKNELRQQQQQQEQEQAATVMRERCTRATACGASGCVWSMRAGWCAGCGGQRAVCGVVVISSGTRCFVRFAVGRCVLCEWRAGGALPVCAACCAWCVGGIRAITSGVACVSVGCGAN